MAFLTAAGGAPKGVDYWAAAKRNAPFWRADFGARGAAAFTAFLLLGALEPGLVSQVQCPAARADITPRW
jgi:hypothetical protein